MHTEIKAIVIDLEGTLFSSKALARAHMLHVVDLLSRKELITEERALELLRSRRRKLATELSFAPPLTILMETLGISRQQLYDEINKVDPSGYLEPDVRLKTTLHELKKKNLKLALLTNASYEYTVRILGALGINADIFDSIVTGSDVRRVKPDIEPFWRILSLLNADPQQILMVGDRTGVDILPAKRLNMKTALISKHYNLRINKGSRRSHVDMVIHDVHDLRTIMQHTTMLTYHKSGAPKP